jgi:hypothetical protein
MTRKTAALIGALVLAACGKHPVTPSSPSSLPLSERQDSAFYSFRHAPGDSIDTTRQEAYHQWALAALDVQLPQRVTYNKFSSRSHMGDVTGHYNTNGYAEPSTFNIYTIWPFDNHEVIHVISALFGSPPALFNEGLAVAHQVDPSRGDFVARWNGTTLHDWARSCRRQGTLLGLGRLLVTSDFRRFDPNVTYPTAGSFVRYLLDTRGLAAVKAFFRGGSAEESAASVRQRFEAVFGRGIDETEREWWALLDRQ